MTVYFIFFISIIFYFLLYYIIFNKFNKYSNNVSGPGAIFPFLILFFITFQNTLILYFITLGLFAIIYWYDDYKGLGIRLRLSLQFLSGFACFLLIMDPIYFDNYFYFFIFCVFFGIWNIFLINTINFYDGNDLNVSILIITIFSFLYFSASFPNNIEKIIVFVLLFVVIFSLFNLFFNKYYFGDSSCFVIANIINFILIFGILSNEFNYNIGLIPFILPIIDVIYVLFLRIILGESFLYVRNYYHLYQRVASKTKGYWYITPTIYFL